MRYLGGKNRVGKQIANFIAGREKERVLLIEPFVGAAGVTEHLAPYFTGVLASDAHEDLILMWRALQTGWEPPTGVSEEDHRRLKYAPPSAVRAFAGFGISFGGDWFHGYARDVPEHSSWSAQAARNSLLRATARMPNVVFECMDYKNIPVLPGAVIYADPPYAGTSGYFQSFDSEQFWTYARHWRASGMHTYVSEFKAPSDWTCVWEKTKTQNLKKRSGTVQHTERLFI